MLRVTRMLVLLVVCSGIYLLLQGYYYRFYLTKPPPGQLIASHAHQTVRDFLSQAHHFRVPVFLIDPLVLKHVTHNPQRQSHCHLCTGRPITSFALNANQWKYDADFLATLVVKGFELMEITGSDPRLVSLDFLAGEEIPLHFLFRLHGYVIQVVLLYERAANFLWHGALRLRHGQDTTFMDFRKLPYGRHAGAYDRLSLSLTVLDGLDVRVPQDISHFLSQHKNSHFLECRHREARHFLQLYPQDSTSSALEFIQRAKSLLQLTLHALNHIGVPFWISSGTCLGWFRQCSIISYSRDVDIGIFISDFSDDIIGALTAAGLRLKHKFGKAEDSLELSFVHADVKLDVFFFYQHGDVLWNGGTQTKTGRKFRYVFPRFSLCWAELLELKVRVPCQTLDYVTANYGASWSVPVTNWDWKSSPSNVQPNGVWPRSQWAELIQVY